MCKVFLIHDYYVSNQFEGGGGRATGRVGSGQALRGSGRVGSDN